mmetsp:Transcript_8322/g.20252  ORF Transcript_8322/g.20252 Transcript_8322/m.20252 type:complete len:260 (+) Transcript_8322:155-934(+)
MHRHAASGPFPPRSAYALLPFAILLLLPAPSVPATAPRLAPLRPASTPLKEGVWAAGCAPALRIRGGGEELDGELRLRLEKLVKKEPVMLFMKGSPDAPQCGFSSRVVKLLTEHKVKFGHFDILKDPQVRAGLKTMSNWPTFPQVYSKGGLIGGLDVLIELAEEGELLNELGGEEKVTEELLEARIRAAIPTIEHVQADDESDGCGAKFSLHVVAGEFEGMPLIERQRMVHAALGDALPRIHALTLKCRTSQQYAATLK